MVQREAAPKYLLSGQVADLLHVSPKTVARWAQDGKLPSIRTLGGHRRFDPQVIASLIAGLDHSDGGAA